MSKRIYITLFCVLALSLVLLGFSFAKESGANDIGGEDKRLDFRVIYSKSQNVDTTDNNVFDVGIINKSDKENSYSLLLKETSGSTYNDVYYSINDGKLEKLENGKIYLGELLQYGYDGDYQSYNIKLVNDDEKREFYLEVICNEQKDLVNVLNNNEQVYKDDEGNLRFYGENVNNYIKYDGGTYRIVGIFDGKIQLIGEAINLGIYSSGNKEYLNVSDFLKSYDKDERLNLDNAYKYKGWLLEDREYWLGGNEDNSLAYYSSLEEGVGISSKNVNLYVRNIYNVDDGMYIGGDGTINNPYEVSYGS